jgi:plastocyanin
MRRAVLAAMAVAFLLAACASESKSRVNVSATDTACRPASASLPAGKTTFAVKNEGKDVTELYVLQGNKTLGEVENVTPGSTRTLTVNLKQGAYDLNCKPGMKGDGIRTPITVTGAGGSSAPASQSVSVTAADFTFHGAESLHPSKGSKVEISMTNNGPSEHEMEILGPDGKVLGEVAPIVAGQTGSAEITFKKTGTYTYQCDFADHLSRGMKGTFQVS